MPYINGSIKRYLRELSERKAVPGGGSASALVAALGVALNLMVINYSFRDGARKHRIHKGFRAPSLKAALNRLSRLIDEDCKAFMKLRQAILSGRNKEKAYIHAATIPLKVCSEAARSIEAANFLKKNANKNLMTDVGCSINFLRAAFNSAALNVYINLKGIKDDRFIKATKKKLKTWKTAISCKL